MDRRACGPGKMIGPSFYVQPEDVEGDRLILRGEEAHHAVHVRRCRIGDRVEVVNGLGTGYEVRVEAIEEGVLHGRIKEVWRAPGEPRIEVILALGLLKGKRFDWVVEKATELGVRRIVPVQMARTVAADPGGGRAVRWRRIARSAMKQCGRSWVPEISSAVGWADAVEAMRDTDVVFVAWEGDEAPALRSVLPADRSALKRVGMMVGPEGGYVPAELDAMKAAGFRFFSLGPRRLRAETAAMLALGVVLYELGELYSPKCI